MVPLPESYTIPFGGNWAGRWMLEPEYRDRQHKFMNLPAHVRVDKPQRPCLAIEPTSPIEQARRWWGLKIRVTYTSSRMSRSGRTDKSNERIGYQVDEPIRYAKVVQFNVAFQWMFRLISLVSALNYILRWVIWAEQLY